MKAKVLLTGANGFVGQGVWQDLLQRGYDVRPVVRTQSVPIASARWGADVFTIPGLSAETDWTQAFSGIHVVVHCAARAHIMRDEVRDPLHEYRRINVQGTLNLARQAASAGVRRFVFISSIKVNGEATLPGHPYRADDDPQPEDAYGISKAEAEVGLQAIAQKTGMELVIIRPVLVYGPGVKGNFKSMVHWVRRGIPLPLGRANGNRRSLVALDNLVDLICTCVDHPRAANQVFLVSDGEDLSTADLLRRIALAQGVTARLLPLPVVFLRWGARLLGKGAVAQRLLGSLQVDIAKTRELLDWQPQLTVDEGLKKLAENLQ